jgi:uncharacterized integral membrane protein (TIGR00697 family)
VFGVPLSISIFYFPFIYIISDVLTEVYGYAVARRVVWYNVAAQLVTMLMFQFVAYYPPFPGSDDSAYRAILTIAPQLVVCGIGAMFIGDIANNYVLAKMKVWSKGKHQAARYVVSTLVGQVVNTAFFYVFGLWGLLPIDSLLESVLYASITKVAVEIVMLPLTIRFANWLKKEEGVDVYDKKTDFNPLII